MDINNAVVNRQALALFNFWLKKQQNDKCIGELTIGDFAEMCDVVNFVACKETGTISDQVQQIHKQ